MSSPRCWPGFAQSDRRRRRCGRGGDGGAVDDGGGNGGAGRIIAAFQGREREEGLEDRISRCWRTKPKIGMRCPGACRYMPSCTLWCGVLSDTSRWSLAGLGLLGLNAPSGVGCFLKLDVGWRRCLRCCLNAPSGAGCFLTRFDGSESAPSSVLIHLLVLGAF